MTQPISFLQGAACVIGVFIPAALALGAAGYMAKKELEAQMNAFDKKVKEWGL